jgi:hypothetical protein
MNKIHALIIFIGFIIFSCRSDNSEKEAKQDVILLDSGPVSEVKILPYRGSLQLPDAILELYTPFGNQAFKPGKVPFEFNIKNFPLKISQNQEPNFFMMLNGEDPVGLNSTVFQRNLAEGTYRLVAFLVDENGFVLKNFGNYLDRDFRVGESRAFPYSAEPYLAVNYPREGQIFDVADQLAVDFLILGGDMRLDGLKLDLLINGDLISELVEMEPIFLQNLPKGTHQITLNLKRIDGKELEGPFSAVTKSVIVR